MPIQYAARTSTLSKKWRRIWSNQPHLVFDCHFFQFVSENGVSATSIIHRILMQHNGPIRGFHLISEGHILAQSDIDPCLIFVSKHGIEKLTLDLANDEKYALPCSIFTCSTLTDLKLSRCFLKPRRHTTFPNLVSLQLEHTEFACGLLGDTLILPRLETLEFRFCSQVYLGIMASPKLKNFSIISSHTITFRCFNVNPMFKSITHLCLDGTSLTTFGWVSVLKRLVEPFNLQSLKIFDLRISVETISCALCLLRSSPNLYELDIDEAVKVDETSTQSQTTELSS
ncbi:putative F-box/FBD/LRR-repeat protein At4g13965 [Lycium barbarum]|uniref:putative F-box/FBD/LRR-repeat protein At4g13965 n=1 Tax=Lycium barbarum TaxID=112863 RepID=UPI00293F5194|nr:putative F-box/FBD/LRR-repeat protein At4g13965 [Lycium barbarum]